MQERKGSTASVPGDLPPKIRKEFSPFIATIATDVFNNITQTGEYPRQWVREFVTPVPKTDFPEDEDATRPISLINDLARDYNHWVVRWLKPYLRKNMDPGQFGGKKGMSITHLMILLFDFVFSKTDNPSKEPHAILTLLLDMSKMFTLIDHNVILTRLSDWSVPPFLLRIIASYPTNRIVRYRGATSKEYSLPSGSSQGDYLI